MNGGLRYFFVYVRCFLWRICLFSQQYCTDFDILLPNMLHDVFSKYLEGESPEINSKTIRAEKNRVSQISVLGSRYSETDKMKGVYRRC